MKIFLNLIILLIAIPAANAHNKVVVIPLTDDPDPIEVTNTTVINVAKSGGDFTDIETALNSINDSSVYKPYHVLIGPGVFNITEPLDVKWGVSVTGSGVGATEIVGIMNSFPEPLNPRDGKTVFISRNNTNFSNFTVNVDGQGEETVKAFTVIEDPRHPAEQGPGIRMSNIDITVESARRNFGVERESETNSIGGLSLDNVNITLLPNDLGNRPGFGGPVNYGVIASTPLRALNIDNSLIEILCNPTQECQGVRAQILTRLTLTNSKIVAKNSDLSDDLPRTAIFVDLGTVSIINSSIITGKVISYDILCDFEGCYPVTNIYNSTLFQNVSGFGISCFNSNNGASSLNSRCDPLAPIN